MICLWDAQGVVGVPISVIVSCLDFRDQVPYVRFTVSIPGLLRTNFRWCIKYANIVRYAMEL
jgi:hypothetical protein